MPENRTVRELLLPEAIAKRVRRSWRCRFAATTKEKSWYWSAY